MTIVEVHLVGPGGAGKSTTGHLLAERVDFRLVDLDQLFMDVSGDINDWIARRGYESYANRNVQNYVDASSSKDNTVYVLSSGFMTYNLDVHARYESIRLRIAKDANTYVLLPSLDKESCVAETLRRQAYRPIPMGSARSEEAKIRQRFATYMAIDAHKVTTMRPTEDIVREIVNFIHG